MCIRDRSTGYRKSVLCIKSCNGYLSLIHILTDVDEWGKKRLAYEIQKMKEAYYYFIHFESDACLLYTSSESIRGAIESVDKGQYEASMAFGLTHFQMMTKIVLPQACLLYTSRCV